MSTPDRTTRVFGFALVCAATAALPGCYWGLGVVVPVDPPPPEPAVGDTPPTPPVDICELGEFRRCSSRCIVGNGPSCNNLGAMYELGMTVPRDAQRALDLYDRACAAGADGGCANAARLRGAPATAPVEPPPEPESAEPEAPSTDLFEHAE